MMINLEDYYIFSKIALDTNLIITFQSHIDVHERRVLELRGVVGFIDKSDGSNVKMLRIDDDGGSVYALDIALRLKRPEVKQYAEAFLFVDDGVTFSYRICAREIRFRNWSENDMWLKRP
jgi:hypothetical protein